MSIKEVIISLIFILGDVIMSLGHTHLLFSATVNSKGFKSKISIAASELKHSFKLSLNLVALLLMDLMVNY